jgi:hypothetical protein
MFGPQHLTNWLEQLICKSSYHPGFGYPDYNKRSRTSCSNIDGSQTRQTDVIVFVSSWDNHPLRFHGGGYHDHNPAGPAQCTWIDSRHTATWIKSSGPQPSAAGPEAARLVESGWCCRGWECIRTLGGSMHWSCSWTRAQLQWKIYSWAWILCQSLSSLQLLWSWLAWRWPYDVSCGWGRAVDSGLGCKKICLLDCSLLSSWACPPLWQPLLLSLEGEADPLTSQWSHSGLHSQLFCY